MKRTSRAPGGASQTSQREAALLAEERPEGKRVQPLSRLKELLPVLLLFLSKPPGSRVS